jgi:NADH-quinone oxidoreductase subunit E
MSFEFNNENVEAIKKLKLRYPKPQALSLPLLWMAQYQEGYISIDAIDAIGEICELPPMEVYRVATFYTMFNLEPIGKYHLQVCKTLSCKLCGAKEITDTIKKELKIAVGETTQDKLFSLSEVECLGSCGTSPVVQINDAYYENLTPQSIVEILGGLK